MVVLNKIPRPARVISIIWGIYFILVLIAPFEYGQVNPYVGIYFFTCFVFLFLGAISKKYQNFAILPIEYPCRYYFRLFLLSFFFGLIGFIFKLVDRFFIRGYSFSLEFMANRSLGIDDSGNFFAIVGSLFFLFSHFSMWLLLSNKFKISLLFRTIVYVMFFYMTIEGVLLGSRFSLLVNVCLFVFFLYFSGRIRVVINQRLVFLMLIVASAFVIIFARIYIARLNYFGGDLYLSLAGGGTVSAVPINEETLSFLKGIQHQRLLHDYLVGVLHLLQYFTHGYFEFQELVLNHFENELPLAFGADTFSVFMKFIFKILPESFFLDVSRLYHRQGTYTTIMGPLFVDFGVLSFVFLFFLGRFAKIVWCRVQSGYFVFVPLYSFVLLVIILSPMINYIKGGVGNYMIFSFSLFWFISKVVKRNNKLKHSSDEKSCDNSRLVD